jgi:hypothetical protein
MLCVFPILLSLSLLAAASTHSVLFLNDLHADPLYNPRADYHDRWCRTEPVSPPAVTVPAGGRFGCDAPLDLVQRAIDAAASVNPNPTLIIVNGDIPAHDMDLGSNHAATAFFVSALTEAFPFAAVVPTIGNNEAWYDYNLPVDGQGVAKYLPFDSSYYDQLAASYGDWLSPSQQHSFSRGGYYESTALPGVRVAALNTVMYTTSFQPSNYNGLFGKLPDSDPAVLVDPNGQMAWLIREAATAYENDQALWIVMHVPPAVNGYDRKPTWRDVYTERFREVLRQLPEGLSVTIYTAHYHSDAFKLVAGRPVFVTPSVAPVNYNNPGFRFLEVTSPERGPAVATDYAQYFLDLARSNVSDDWTFRLLYRFAGEYAQDIQDPTDPLSATTLSHILNRIFEDQTAYARFYDLMHLGYQGSRLAYTCGALALTSTEFADCDPL